MQIHYQTIWSSGGVKFGPSISNYATSYIEILNLLVLCYWKKLDCVMRTLPITLQLPSICWSTVQGSQHWKFLHVSHFVLLCDFLCFMQIAAKPLLWSCIWSNNLRAYINIYSHTDVLKFHLFKIFNYPCSSAHEQKVKSNISGVIFLLIYWN